MVDCVRQETSLHAAQNVFFQNTRGGVAAIVVVGRNGEDTILTGLATGIMVGAVGTILRAYMGAACTTPFLFLPPGETGTRPVLNGMAKQQPAQTPHATNIKMNQAHHGHPPPSVEEDVVVVVIVVPTTSEPLTARAVARASITSSSARIIRRLERSKTKDDRAV
uniref:Uncharacterized protein n=1 Tax=Noctiluca scintillans TaxID=2966 RepID=A0A7S0ZPP1_NOCSC